MFQPELEALERDALIALQLERARTSLARVLRQPAWTKRLGGVGAGDIRTLGDWARLPFLTKAELRDAYPLGLSYPNRPSGAMSQRR